MIFVKGGLETRSRDVKTKRGVEERFCLLFIFLEVCTIQWGEMSKGRCKINRNPLKCYSFVFMIPLLWK
jgi:hypothetical protein